MPAFSYTEVCARQVLKLQRQAKSPSIGRLRPRAPAQLNFPLRHHFPTPFGRVPPAVLFSSTKPSLKKKNSKIPHTEQHEASPASPPESSLQDFSDLKSKIEDSTEVFKASLTRMGTHGRGNANPAMIEALPVEINIPADKGGAGQSRWKLMDVKGAPRKATEKVKLGDIATVLQRSLRLLVVVVHDPHHRNVVSNAILSSPYSLTPTSPSSPPGAASTGPLSAPSAAGPGSVLRSTNEIHIVLPPPTTEARTHVLTDAKAALERAKAGIRTARSHWQKDHRAESLKRKHRADDLHAAHKEMEALVKKSQDGLEGVWEAWRKRVDK